MKPSLLSKTKRELHRHLTFMVIPHNTVRPLRITFTLSFILFMIGCWTGLTLWAGYLTSRHIDYWRIQTEHNMMKLKVSFFAQQVKKSREMLDQVKENDESIRSLLQFKSKKEIIETEGRGGPASGDADDLDRLLTGKIQELSYQDIHWQTSTLIDETKKRIESQSEITDYVEQQRSLYRAVPNCRPCVGNVTSPFGHRIHPIYKSYENHTGLDIANVKNTPVYATAYGTVKLSDWVPGYGRLVIIDHGYDYQTYYAHLHKIMVRPGETIRRGQLIALMGNTGTSTGTHLHYEIKYRNRPTDPTAFFKKDFFSASSEYHTLLSTKR